MKSLKDSLREEFYEIIKDSEVKQLIVQNNLDTNIINAAFEKLLENIFSSDDEQLLEKSRADFEVYIINEIKSLSKYDN